MTNAEGIYSFPKSERLCGQTHIKDFYEKGEHFTCYPLRVTWLSLVEPGVKVLVWAPKSLFRHAVQRNHLRRLIREAYRLNAIGLKQKYTDTGLQLAFNYIAKEELSFHQINKAVQKAILKLCKL